METLPDRIKYLRKMRSKNQADISELLGIRRSTYGEYERGIINPPMDKIQILANYYNVTIDYITGNDNNDSNDNSIDVITIINDIVFELKSDQSFIIDGNELKEKVRKNLIYSLETTAIFAKMANLTKNVQDE